jgi:hypothetical protein
MLLRLGPCAGSSPRDGLKIIYILGKVNKKKIHIGISTTKNIRIGNQ